MIANCSKQYKKPFPTSGNSSVNQLEWLDITSQNNLQTVTAQLTVEPVDIDGYSWTSLDKNEPQSAQELAHTRSEQAK